MSDREFRHSPHGDRLHNTAIQLKKRQFSSDNLTEFAGDLYDLIEDWIS